jgi:lipid-A-disaccharide synthase
VAFQIPKQLTPPTEPYLFWSAGEASGDHHASSLILAIEEIAPQAYAHFGLGGQAMAKAGATIPIDMTRTFSIIGFTAILRAYPALRRIMNLCVQSWKIRPPAAVVCVDYPGFNLVLAQKAHQLGIPVLWYIAPQVWAWKAGRTRKLRAWCRQVYPILPFEESFLRDRGVECEYLGNPLLDELPSEKAPCRQAQINLGLDSERPIVGILPGSRTKEILRHMPLLVQTMDQMLKTHPQLQFLLPLAPTVDETVIRAFVQNRPELPLTFTRDLTLARLAMDVALCKSGTSTLELAVTGVPMVIFYITSALNAFIARRLLTIPHIGLVNLVAGREVAPEQIQEAATAPLLAAQLEKLLPGTPAHQRQLEDLQEVRNLLGQPGASLRVARTMLKCLQPSIHSGPSTISP